MSGCALGFKSLVVSGIRQRSTIGEYRHDTVRCDICHTAGI